MASDRKFFVGGNWKMNGNKESIEKIFGFLKVENMNKETGRFYRSQGRNLTSSCLDSYIVKCNF